MPPLLNSDTLVSLVSLTALETVLGIDNIIFLSILVAKLPLERQAVARNLGITLALGTRILLLLTLSWLAGLRAPLFSLVGHEISGRDLVLILGGLFLMFKSVSEIFTVTEAADDPEEDYAESHVSKAFVSTLAQIVIMDIVFSLDSVITAVGMAPHVLIMITAMVFSMFVMLLFAKTLGDFVTLHPSIKVLALSFLVLVGALLMAEGAGQKINKAYVYFAMAFSFAVEMLNIRMRKRRAAASR